MELPQILITVMIGLGILMATITILIFGIIKFFKELKYIRIELDNINYDIINIVLDRDREKIEQKEREREQNEHRN